MYRVGSLIGGSDATPNFAVYDIADEGGADKKAKIDRRVFVFLPHLNPASNNAGGWKRVHLDVTESGLF